MTDEDDGPYFASIRPWIYGLLPKFSEFGRRVEQGASTDDLEKELIDEFKKIILTDDAYRAYLQGHDDEAEKGSS